MKKVITTLVLIVLALSVKAQTCKIKIFYDANGNRILRAKECSKPASNESTSITGPTSINLAGSYQVYPNPAENKVNVKLDLDLLGKGCNILMTDIAGKILFQKTDVDQAVSVIDLYGYADGTYFVTIVQGTNRQTVKIVRQTGR